MYLQLRARIRIPHFILNAFSISTSLTIVNSSSFRCVVRPRKICFHGKNVCFGRRCVSLSLAPRKSFRSARSCSVMKQSEHVPSEPLSNANTKTAMEIDRCGECQLILWTGSNDPRKRARERERRCEEAIESKEIAIEANTKIALNGICYSSPLRGAAYNRFLNGNSIDLVQND